MCDHSILVQRKYACIRYCYNCDTYTILFNNLALNLDRRGFSDFKASLQNCYENYSGCSGPKRQARNIYFNTLVEGMQFLFCIDEVGDLLSIIQEAELEEIQLTNP